MTQGSRHLINVERNGLAVPDEPAIPYIQGDGVGVDITPVALKVIDSAVERAYGGERRIRWLKAPAGEEAFQATGLDPDQASTLPEDDLQRLYLPDETVDAIENHVVAIKGPLTTPVGSGFRSLNVALRQRLELYACVRPVKWYTGVPSPLQCPELLDVVIFRENTEDVYSGIEWGVGSEETARVRGFLNSEMGCSIPDDSAIGVKPVSVSGSKRLVRAAIRYAINNDRRNVTLVHKGNIMKYTEGAFRDWGYEVATQEYRRHVVTEAEFAEGVDTGGRVLVKDRIADQMFQQLLLRPDEYDVIATLNLNGDYLSDACAAEVGGLGIAPGANINYETRTALFEPTHGSAPRHAGLNEVNPSSMILSAVMMLRYMGWGEAADLTEDALEKAINSGRVTYDLHRQMVGATRVSTSEFGEVVVECMD